MDLTALRLRDRVEDRVVSGGFAVGTGFKRNRSNGSLGFARKSFGVGLVPPVEARAT